MMLWWITQNALVTGLLAAVVAAVCRLGRFSPAVKHALWMLVLVKLVTPPIGWYRVPPSLDAWLRRLTMDHVPQPIVDSPPSAGDGLVAELADEVEIVRRLVKGDQQQALPQPIELRECVNASPEDHANSQRWRAAWLPLLAWLTGAVPVTFIQLTRLIRLWRFVRHSASAPTWLDRLVQQTAEKLNVRPPKAAVVSALCSPMVCALGRPRLLWPAKLSDHLAAQEREAVLLHELAHLRRRDHWVAWLELVAGVIWWFNPVYWYARYQLRENAEMACDAWVVAILPGGRRAYAQALIEVTEFVSCAPAALPAVAMGNIARSSLERRLTMILKERMSYRVPLMACGLIALALLAVLPGWSRGQTSQSPAASNKGERAVQVGDLLAQVGVEETGGSNQPFAQPLSQEFLATPAVQTPAPQTLPDSPQPAIPQQGSQNSALQGPAVGQPSATPVVQPNAFPTSSPTGSVPPSRDEQRLTQLEIKLTQLLELLERRGISADPRANDRLPGYGPQTGPGYQYQQIGPGVTPSASGHYQAFNGPKDVSPTRSVLRPNVGQARVRDGGEAVETLTRAKYKLPQDASEALAAFIKQFAKADVDARAEGGTLTVTASQEDQRRIANFVEMLKEREPSPNKGY